MKKKLLYIHGALLLCSLPAASGALILNPPMSITHQVTVQPIIVSDDSGNNPATFLGNSAQEEIIKTLVDQIWAQAGIDVAWEPAVGLNSSEGLNGAGGSNGNDPRPRNDLSGDPSGESLAAIGNNAFVTTRDGETINMFFVDVNPGFSELGNNQVAGLAERPGVGGFGDDVSIYVGNILPSFLEGQLVVAAVIAHEIGHTLSLEHVDLSENLLQEGAGNGERLNGSQISDALQSRGLTAIPEPGTTAFLLAGTALLMVKRRRQ